MNELIAVVDDEKDILELISVNLKKNGFKARLFQDGSGFLKAAEKNAPALAILDLMLPDMDGFEICRRMKGSAGLSSIPVIMLTAKSEETDKVLGLELGADDYMTKPRELVARVKAVLRRKTPAAPASDRGAFVIDREKFEVRSEGKKVGLTTTEFKILELLASKRGFVFSRDKILDAVWGGDIVVTDRTVDVHITNLRDKLGKAGALIKNIRGVGYKLEE